MWWVEHPDAGRRPFLILTRQAAIPILSSVLGVPATRTIRQIPTEVVLDRADGMPEECALSLDNLTTVPKELFRDRITRQSKDRGAIGRNPVPILADRVRVKQQAEGKEP